MVDTFGRCENRLQNLVGTFGGKSQLEDLRTDGIISKEKCVRIYNGLIWLCRGSSAGPYKH